MEVKKNINGNCAELSVFGRLDTTTAPELEKCIKEIIDDVDKLEMDFAGLEYVSSAGLRVLLSTHKIMSKKSGMVIKNVIPEIMEVFEITGFDDFLTIE